MFCTSCGSTIPENSRFCTSCGTAIKVDVQTAKSVQEVVNSEKIIEVPVDTSSRADVKPKIKVDLPSSPPIQKEAPSPTNKAHSKFLIIVSLVIVLGSASVAFIWYSNAERNSSLAKAREQLRLDSIAAVKKIKIDSIASIQEKELHQIPNSVPQKNQFSPTGKFIGSIPCYIINTIAVTDESVAIRKANELKDKGYNAGYLWIPDYPSLSGAQYYSIFIGPFYSESECVKELDAYKKIQPGVYALLVSNENKRNEISGSQTISSNNSKIVLITAEGVRFRTNPNVGNDNIIEVFELGDECEFIQRGLKDTQNGITDYWYSVRFKNREGWVFGAFTSLKN